MAALGAQTVAASYEQLLHVDTDGGGNGNNLLSIKDGDNGTTFGLKLATNKVEVIPGSNDANAFEVSQADGTAVFTVNSSTVGATLIGTLTVGADDAGHDVIFYGDTANSNMTWDTSADDLILNDATLFIDQDLNLESIKIDSESTTYNVLDIRADALTTGSALYVASDSNSGSSRALVYIVNDNVSAVNTIPLKIQQDSTNVAIALDDPKCTSDNIMQVTNADALTGGGILYLESDAVDNSTRNLVTIVNDNASADNTVGLYIKQDGADASIELAGAGGGGIKFTADIASSDSDTLDDYEEGIHTTAITGGTSGSFTLESDNQSLAYTKIGRMVTVQGKFQTSTGSGSGQLKISMPFTANNSLDDNADMSVGAITMNRTGSTSPSTQMTAIIFANNAFVNIQLHNESNANETYLQADDVDGTFEGQIGISYIV